MLKKKLLAVFLVLMMVFALIGCMTPQNVQPNQQGQQSQQSTEAGKAQATQSLSGKLVVSYIDVGQGDSILVQAPDGKNMLVDAGIPDMGVRVVSYLKSRGVHRIDILVSTHPHDDHIGGMPDVIRTFAIGKIYMPKKGTTTYSFEKQLNAIRAKGLKVNTAKAGVVLDMGKGISAKMLAPNSTRYDDLNNYSAVIKVVYGKTSFLFTGDAGAQSEQEMLNAKYDLRADVLKVSHHGSTSATTLQFLNAVKPKYAVISCGKGNDYGHPAALTMNKLKADKIPVYRTDESSTIVATSDGNSISFNVKPGDYTPGRKGGVSGNNVGNGKSNSGGSSNNSGNGQSSGIVPYGYYGTPGKVYVDSNGKGMIKGNINSKGEKIYHIPGDKWYDKTHAEKWFKTEVEAQKAGFRPPKN